ncbi:carbon-nitrogen hydrolase family protein [Streptomyces sp. NPDC050433]|uniref:carbon-nitrogen hydrolase family protein n=1 Tax=Streptomyces sp. NPDC050433 TaxID=3365615 RepID=UPI0037B5D131
MTAPRPLRVAACQLGSGQDLDTNLAQVERVLAAAAERGARLAVLPEALDYMGPAEDAVPEPLDSRASRFIADLAAAHGMWVLAGSVHERPSDGEGLPANTAQLFAPDGTRAGTYRKTHLFDVELADGFSYRESDTVRPGDSLMTHDIDGVSTGTAICYDLRFPELFRLYAAAGARVLLLPAAFTAHTGAAHWEILLRARAIENQCFVVAAGQFGPYAPNGRSYGRSMVIDPWGTVLACTPDRPEAVAVADLDFAYQDECRAQVPSLANRRDDLYELSLRHA